ncbi:RagB/SusD family nutrient uptake outer membrane protein [Odoribacter splanchnicus]|uniref:RagB/SusD family nutrient uptake outer membrane protein n=1 Tax=Odoribacter splanchnicus TaxID=28118 RepID=UPI000E530A06|nr:RagB/SusD family nutrient uptake outer membrane protein [Odoribacter splanchnicus]RHA41745.1 hypothetical protein DW936_06410 [Odoribacter splanchnicus]
MKIKIGIRLAILSILVLSMVGCEKWLDVRPESEVGEEDMFSTEQGFMDALYGVYVSMGKEDLYGGTFPLTMDVLAKLFNVHPGNSHENFVSYNYLSSDCADVIDKIWERLYYCVSLTNNILKHLEDESPETLNSYWYLKGECLALRAFLHYEILRVFAPNIKDQPEYVSIPYRKNYSNLIDPQLKVKEVFEKILIDLQEAKEALKEDVIRTEKPVFVSGNTEEDKESEDVTDKNENYYMSSFLANRKYRMNYYGVLATMARVYLDRSAEGDREKAYECAMEIIESGKFRLVQYDDFIVPSGDIKKRDALFTDEFIFGLFSSQVDVWYDSHCWPAGSYQNRFFLVDVQKNIFEDKVNDLRYRLVEKDSETQDMLLKKHFGDYEKSKQKIRVLTLAEMYYIASEVKPEKASVLMDSIARYRGITPTISDNTSSDDRMREIVKEYRKEFLGDGQFFFTFKRLAGQSFLNNMNLGIRKEDKILVLPLPEAEIEYGERVSEIWK